MTGATFSKYRYSTRGPGVRISGCGSTAGVEEELICPHLCLVYFCRIHGAQRRHSHTRRLASAVYFVQWNMGRGDTVPDPSQGPKRHFIFPALPLTPLFFTVKDLPQMAFQPRSQNERHAEQI